MSQTASYTSTMLKSLRQKVVNIQTRSILEESQLASSRRHAEPDKQMPASGIHERHHLRWFWVIHRIEDDRKQPTKRLTTHECGHQAIYSPS